jgi:Mrp family chromosome partitioning ATPase
LLIQPYSDGIVLVARPNYTQENMLGEAIDQLVESELGLLGAIINGADIIVSVPEEVAKSSTFTSQVEQSEEVSASANKN